MPIRTHVQLLEDIRASINDNADEEISEADARNRLIDIADTMFGSPTTTTIIPDGSQPPSPPYAGILTRARGRPPAKSPPTTSPSPKGPVLTDGVKEISGDPWPVRERRPTLATQLQHQQPSLRVRRAELVARAPAAASSGTPTASTPWTPIRSRTRGRWAATRPSSRSCSRRGTGSRRRTGSSVRPAPQPTPARLPVTTCSTGSATAGSGSTASRTTPGTSRSMPPARPARTVAG